MKVILNIGLARDGNKNIGVGTVLRELDLRGFATSKHAIHPSDTEITVVAEVEAGASTSPFYYLAQALGQDCIAVYAPELETAGRLIGPNAIAWGDFNPELFILLDGTRLAQHSKEI